MVDKKDSFGMPNVARGSFLVVISTGLILLSNFLFFIILSKFFDPEEIGVVSLLIFIINVLNASSSIPFSVTASKYISESKTIATKSAVFFKTRKLALLTSVFSVAIAYFVIPLVSTNQIISSNLLLLTIFSALAKNVIDFYSYVFLGYGSYSVNSKIRALFSTLSRGLAITLGLNFSLIGVMGGWLIGALVAMGYGISKLKISETTESFSTKKIVGYGAPIGIVTVIFVIQNYLDSLLLYAISDDISKLGIYFIVANTAYVIVAFSSAPISTAILPALSSRFGKKGIISIAKPINILIKLSGLIILPLGVFMIAVPEQILETIYSVDYANESQALIILSIGMVLQGFSLILIAGFNSIGKTKIVMVIVVIGLLLEIISILGLYDVFGVNGIALSRTMMYVLIFILSIIIFKKYVSIKFDVLHYIKLLISGGLIFGILFGLNKIVLMDLPSKYSLIISFIIFGLLWISTIRYFRLLKEEEFEIVNEFIPLKSDNLRLLLKNLLISKRSI